VLLSSAHRPTRRRRRESLDASLLAYAGRAPTRIEQVDFARLVDETVRMAAPLIDKAVQLRAWRRSAAGAGRAEPHHQRRGGHRRPPGRQQRALGGRRAAGRRLRRARARDRQAARRAAGGDHRGRTGDDLPPGGRVLLVDDEAAIRRLGRRILESAGHEVLVAPAATEVLVPDHAMPGANWAAGPRGATNDAAEAGVSTTGEDPGGRTIFDGGREQGIHRRGGGATAFGRAGRARETALRAARGNPTTLRGRGASTTGEDRGGAHHPRRRVRATNPAPGRRATAFGGAGRGRELRGGARAGQPPTLPRGGGIDDGPPSAAPPAASDESTGGAQSKGVRRGRAGARTARRARAGQPTTLRGAGGIDAGRRAGGRDGRRHRTRNEVGLSAADLSSLRHRGVFGHDVHQPHLEEQPAPVGSRARVGQAVS
jgi:hypothetical protein